MHTTVLLEETIAALKLQPGMVVGDFTLGGGGHARAALNKITPGGHLYGLDRDLIAIERASEALVDYKEAYSLRQGNFSQCLELLDYDGEPILDGVVMDLGVSSFQLDCLNRGFSYRNNDALDMRMDQSSGFSACDVVNNYSQEKLAQVIREYGEERYARRIAGRICTERAKKRIENTDVLAAIIRAAIPAQAARKEKQHPARRTFQAIRIEVNNELDSIRQALDGIVLLLKPGGRAAIISFHSLEDRIVKEFFVEKAKGCVCPPRQLNCTCLLESQLKIITRKAVLPTAEEIADNPRARSAKLRVAEKI